jgi:hypothetical protein
MKASPFLLGSSLLFWGWQSGFVVPAIVLAFMLESARLIRWRLPISDKAFARLFDLSALILLVIVAYHFTVGHFPQSLFLIFQWLPLILFPLVCTQVYSTGNQINIGAASLILGSRSESYSNIRIDALYLASCVLGAAAANVQTFWFYVGSSALLIWSLFGMRPKRHSPILWCALMLLAMGGGYAGHIGLSLLQSKVQEASTEWLTEFFNSETDPYQSTTQIGKLGMIKLSDRILIRVKSTEDRDMPKLLRDAAYNTYTSGTWLTRPNQFHPVSSDRDSTSWTLNSTSSPSSTVEISLYSNRDLGVLVLPLGTTRVSNLPATGVEINDFGGVKVNGVHGLVIFQAQFSPSSSHDSSPKAGDLQIPANLVKPLSTIAGQLKLEGQPPNQAIGTIERFFSDNFKYTLFLGNAETGPKRLEDFLLNSHAGHCEYFATATVLLLRKAGIPARYATGYSVQEFSSNENLYLVRARHAHAWALAYVGGQWREIDTTPAVWATAEEDRKSIFQPLFDLGSLLNYRFSLLRMNKIKELDFRSLIPVSLSIVVAWVWWLRKKHSVIMPQIQEKAELNNTNLCLGKDSPFFRVVEKLSQGNVFLENGETLTRWINRIGGDGDGNHLRELLNLHYRYRFDPAGIDEAEKEKLHTLTEIWLQKTEN